MENLTGVGLPTLADITPGHAERQAERQATDEAALDELMPGWRDGIEEEEAHERERVAAGLTAIAQRAQERQLEAQRRAADERRARFLCHRQAEPQGLRHHVGHGPVRVRGALRAGRPAGRRMASASAPPGSSDDGPAPLAVQRFARAAGLSLDGVRWCRWCQRVAFAQDEYQRRYLDCVGFIALCPDCRREAGL